MKAPPKPATDTKNGTIRQKLFLQNSIGLQDDKSKHLDIETYAWLMCIFW